jgi:hypothetical protein
MTDEPLFMEGPTFSKLSSIELSDDPASWETDIILHVHEKLPFVASFPLGLQFDKVADKTGYGYGYLTIGDESQVKVSAPLIVKEWQLEPIDVFIKEGEFYPLNEKRLQEALFDNRMFSGSELPEDGTGGYANNYPPHSGKYVYASAGQGSILEAINGTVMQEDKQYFLDKLADDQIRVGYQMNDHEEVVRKIAALEAAKTASQPLHKVLRPDVVQITKVADKRDTYLMQAVSDQLYAPVTKEMSGDEVIEKFGSESLTHILENGEYSTVRGERPAKPVVMEAIVSEMKILNGYGRCEVRTALNDRVSGWLFPKVVNFDGVSLGADKLFTDGCSMYGLQQDFAGVDLPEDPSCGRAPPCHKMEIGATGVFYYDDGGGRAFCTVPFTIISAPVDLGDLIRMEVRTALGEGLIFEITNGTEAIMTSRRDRMVRFIPAKMKFCKIGKCMRFQDDPEAVVKFAHSKLAATGCLQVSSLNDGQTFSLAGTYEETLEGGGSNVPRTRAKFHLMALGMSPEDAELALCRAAENGRATITNMQPLMTVVEKEAQVRSEVIEPLLAVLPSLKTDLIKEAAFLGDADTVDSVLSLNFINLENIKTFVDYVPKLKEAASKTAELLTASRLGFGTVPGEAAKKAMVNLERVISNLESLGAAAQAHPQMRM